MSPCFLPPGYQVAQHQRFRQHRLFAALPSAEPGAKSVPSITAPAPSARRFAPGASGFNRSGSNDLVCLFSGRP
jgi:hypothetical protein